MKANKINYEIINPQHTIQSKTFSKYLPFIDDFLIIKKYEIYPNDPKTTKYIHNNGYFFLIIKETETNTIF
jgi:hypothetical protein